MVWALMQRLILVMVAIVLALGLWTQGTMANGTTTDTMVVEMTQVSSSASTECTDCGDCTDRERPEVADCYASCVATSVGLIADQFRPSVAAVSASGPQFSHLGISGREIPPEPEPPR